MKIIINTTFKYKSIFRKFGIIIALISIIESESDDSIADDIVIALLN